MSEYRFPVMVIEDGRLKIPVKRGGFAFDGSNLVVDLDQMETAPAGTGSGRTGRRRDQQDEAAATSE